MFVASAAIDFVKWLVQSIIFLPSLFFHFHICAPLINYFLLYHHFSLDSSLDPVTRQDVSCLELDLATALSRNLHLSHLLLLHRNPKILKSTISLRPLPTKGPLYQYCFRNLYTGQPGPSQTRYFKLLCGQLLMEIFFQTFKFSTA